ncbi:MAG: hypothetical protein ACE5GV_14355, partial [Candidatus Scalindua sp.]
SGYHYNSGVIQKLYNNFWGYKEMKKSLIIVLFLAMPANVFAIVIGGSNLGIFGYPSHDCTKPTKPIKPYSFSSQWEIDSYNDEVERYNSGLEQYINCIQEYVDNVNNDIKRINEKAEEAIDEASY